MTPPIPPPTTPPWYSKYSNLPFDCTSCGKCCQTQGTVWMSPNDVSAAAALLRLSKETFITSYASHTVQQHDDTYNDDNHYHNNNNYTWVRLANHPQNDHCVFLTPDNQCQIYNARPTQCSTYPFWTDILASKSTWNDQVRLPDYENDDSPIPYWTAELGGCEGMKLIPPIQYPTNCTTNVGVDTMIVHAKLKQYQQDEDQFPTKWKVIRRKNNSESCWDDNDDDNDDGSTIMVRSPIHGPTEHHSLFLLGFHRNNEKGNRK